MVAPGATAGTITEIKRALVDLLGGPEFDAIVRECGTALGVPVPTPVIAEIHRGERATLQGFPAGEIVGVRSSPVGDSDAQHYGHQVLVIWTVTGSDEQAITDLVELLVVATRELTFRALLTLRDGSAAPMVPGDEDYSRLSRTRGLPAPLIKGGAIEIRVPTLTH